MSSQLPVRGGSCSVGVKRSQNFQFRKPFKIRTWDEGGGIERGWRRRCVCVCVCRGVGVSQPPGRMPGWILHLCYIMYEGQARLI